MKGIIRIVEAVIASIILLSSLTYFIFPYVAESGWGDLSLKMKVQDYLSSMDINDSLSFYINRNNGTLLYENIAAMLSGPTGFSVEIVGLPNDIIYISCLSEEDRDKLTYMLQPTKFLFNGRSIEFRISNISDIDINKIDPRTNIIFIFNYQQLDKEKINKILESKKSIFMISELDENQINDGIMNEIFGLKYNSGSDQIATFYNTTDPSKISYKIAKYFSSIPFRVDVTREGKFYLRENEYKLNTYINDNGEECVEYGIGTCYKIGESFNVTDGDYIWNLKVYDIDGNISDDDTKYADIGLTNRSYIFKINSKNVEKNDKSVIANLISGASVNYKITKYGYGRTVWLNNYTYAYNDNNQLLKSLLLWASGEDYMLISDVSNTFFTISYLKAGNIYFEPYEIKLNVWHIFY